jgi:hypothetical protein
MTSVIYHLYAKKLYLIPIRDILNIMMSDLQKIIEHLRYHMGIIPDDPLLCICTDDRERMIVDSNGKQSILHIEKAHTSIYDIINMCT